MLPNIPTFIYGPGDTELAFTLPITPWARSLRAVGGDIEAESGNRTGFVVRRDELLTFDLRFHEDEWPPIQDWMDFAQTGASFIWFPDSNDLSLSYTVALDAPASGSTYQTTLDEGLPRIQHLLITLMEPGNPLNPWNELPPFERRIPIVPPGPLQPVTLTIDPQMNYFEEDETDPLQLEYEFRNFRDEIVPDIAPTSWEADNAAAASVDANGLVTAHTGAQFILDQDNDFTVAPWTNAGAGAVVAGGTYHGHDFWRVLSTSLPKQIFVPASEFDGEFFYTTVFVRADGVDEDDETTPTGTFEGGVYDITNGAYRMRWRFTIATGGAIAVTTLAGALVRSATLTDMTRAFTFKSSIPLVDAAAYEFRVRDGGTAASLLCAWAILNPVNDAVSAVRARYDFGPTHLVSNHSVQMAEVDPVIIVRLPDDDEGGIHISGTFTIFAVGGGGGGSSGCGGGGARIDGTTISADCDLTWTVGGGGNPGSPTGSNGVQTVVNASGLGTIVNAAGGSGAGSEHGGSANGGLGGDVAGQGCGLDGASGGGGGGAGNTGPGHNAIIVAGCMNCFTAAGGGGDGSPLLFEHRIYAIWGPGGGGQGTFFGSCSASRGAGGFVGGGIGGLNSSGGQGADRLGAGGGNGAAGTRGAIIILYRPGEAVIT